MIQPVPVESDASAVNSELCDAQRLCSCPSSFAKEVVSSQSKSKILF